MFAFRFVRPVTIASGNVVPTAAVVGVGVAPGDEADVGPGVAGGPDWTVLGEGTGLSQAVSDAAITATARARTRRPLVTGRRDDGSARGTPRMVGGGRGACR